MPYSHLDDTETTDRNMNPTTAPSYDPGTWGHYTNDLNGKLMEGFQIEPPQIDDICGEYDILFVASFTPHNEDDKETPFRWHLRQKTSGSLLIIRHPLAPPGIELMAYCAKVVFTGQSGPLHKCIRYGYNAFGFGVGFPGEANDYCSNCLPMKCLGMPGRGHLGVVSQRKAFPMIQPEEGRGTFLWTGDSEDDEDVEEDSEEEEEEEDSTDDSIGEPTNRISAADATAAAMNHAQRIYNTRHYSFLCREMGLSCVLATLITQYIGNDVLPKPEDYPPYLYAEPGDIWMGGKLSSRNTRTYLLARKRHDNQTTPGIQSQFIANMTCDISRLGYMAVTPREIAPFVKWMQRYPGKKPPPSPVWSFILQFLRSIDDRCRTTISNSVTVPTTTTTSNTRRNRRPAVAARRSDEGGVMTRSRARRNRQETERVLRPRLKKVCYRT